MASRLEAAHGAFPLSGRLVRVFRAIIQSFVLSVLDAPQDLPLRCAIAGEFISDDHAWNVLAALEQLAEERYCCNRMGSTMTHVKCCERG